MDPKSKRFMKERLSRGNIVAFTGAGISYESGIPTFRGRGGLWERYDPQLFATAEGLASVTRGAPEKMRRFMAELFSVLLAASPNPAHIALAELERAGLLNGVITQNVDNLHQRAGSRSVAELHGNCFRIRCARCRTDILLERERLAEMVKLLQAPLSKTGLLKVKSRYFPKCACGGRFRTDVVLFGEMLPEGELEKASRLIEGCSVLLVIGSSLTVYPAAAFPTQAKQRGAALVEINSEPTGICDFSIRGKAAETLPAIVKEVLNG